MSMGIEDIDFSALAPPMEHGEALSSWLVRIAEAHLLTVTEMRSAIGWPLTAVERGNIAALARISYVTHSTPTCPVTLPDLIASPLRSGPPPPLGWAVCRSCLDGDLQAGRAPHVRLSWTHPLAVWCHGHDQALVPHGNSEVKIAGAATLELDSRWGEQKDIPLEAATFDDRRMLERVRRSLNRFDSVRATLALRTAIGDVAAALALRTHASSAPLVSLFEEPLLQRPSRKASLHFDEEWWAQADGPKRLLHARLAMAILAEPHDPAAKRTPGKPLPLGWLMARYRHYKHPGWRSAFDHAIEDPLFLLAIELPSSVVQELGRRSQSWPADLRRRWTYAAAAGAIAGFVL